jgi:hypothetical protein
MIIIGCAYALVSRNLRYPPRCFLPTCSLANASCGYFDEVRATYYSKIRSLICDSEHVITHMPHLDLINKSEPEHIPRAPTAFAFLLIYAAFAWYASLDDIIDERTQTARLSFAIVFMAAYSNSCIMTIEGMLARYGDDAAYQCTRRKIVVA